MILATQKHQKLIENINNFQAELRTYILSFRDGFETGASVHGIQKPDLKINTLLTDLQNSLILDIDFDEFKENGEDVPYLWIKYKLNGRTYYFRRSYNSEAYENFDEKKLAGILFKYHSTISSNLNKLRTYTDVTTFTGYQRRFEEILENYFLG